VERTVNLLGLESSINRPGRPRKGGAATRDELGSLFGKIPECPLKRVLTGDKSGFVTLWDLEKGVNLAEWETSKKRWIESIAITADGRTALSGGSGGTLQLWNVETGKAIISLTKSRHTKVSGPD
jgi:WD40 repeat protein